MSITEPISINEDSSTARASISGVGGRRPPMSRMSSQQMEALLAPRSSLNPTFPRPPSFVVNGGSATSGGNMNSSIAQRAVRSAISPDIGSSSHRRSTIRRAESARRPQYRKHILIAFLSNHY